MTGHERDEDGFLPLLGERVKRLRAQRGMTRKLLARDSGVSERYLAQLEGGTGNASVLVVRQIARALGVPVESLFADAEPNAAHADLLALIRALPDDRLGEARTLLSGAFPVADPQRRRHRIALIGLRGAGKSTLGTRLAADRGVPFVELDREIERAAGVGLATIFDIYGQAGYRRLEREALEATLAAQPAFVLAAGGSIVSEGPTYERLLSACFTVWLSTSPAEHMARVVAQGDLRPMADNAEAMEDLRRILVSREPLYRRADAEVPTGGRTIDASVAALTAVLPAP